MHLPVYYFFIQRLPEEGGFWRVQGFNLLCEENFSNRFNSALNRVVLKFTPHMSKKTQRYYA